MGSRLIGSIAVVIGVVAVGASLTSDGPLPIKAILGGIVFIGLGCYYLISGKKAASVKEFVVDGKLTSDKKE